MTDHENLTRTLAAARTGDRQAAADLMPLLYNELRNLGRSLLRRQPPRQTLQATALVHEAYAKLIGNRDPGWDGSRHFFGAASQAMREILVDQARRRAAAKRGGDRGRRELEAKLMVESHPLRIRILFLFGAEVGPTYCTNIHRSAASVPTPMQVSGLAQFSKIPARDFEKSAAN